MSGELESRISDCARYYLYVVERKSCSSFITLSLSIKAHKPTVAMISAYVVNMNPPPNTDARLNTKSALLQLPDV